MTYKPNIKNKAETIPESQVVYLVLVNAGYDDVKSVHHTMEEAMKIAIEECSDIIRIQVKK
jgi:hypothetical protein